MFTLVRKDGTITAEPQTIISCAVLLGLTIHFLHINQRSETRPFTFVIRCRTFIATMGGRFPVGTWMETDSQI